MMATGARWPKWPRKVGWAVSESGTSTWTTAKRTPPSSMSWALRCRQASTNDGRGQGGHVEDGAPPRHPFQGPGHGRVGQLDHDAGVGAQLPDAQGGLQGVYLVDLDADHGQGPGQAGLEQGVAEVGAATDVGDAPVLEDPGEARVGVVVDHDDRCAAEVELLDRAEPDALEAAHDHVVAQLRPRLWFHAPTFSIWSVGDCGFVRDPGCLGPRRATG